MLTVPPKMKMPPPCKRLRQSGSFLEMSSIDGRMFEKVQIAKCLTNCQTGQAHVSYQAWQLQWCDGRRFEKVQIASFLTFCQTGHAQVNYLSWQLHLSPSTPQHPWLMRLKSPSSGAMERYETGWIQNWRACSRSPAERNETHTSVTPAGRWKNV